MGQTILVIDDDEVLGRVLVRVLAREGFAVRHALTVQQGVDQFKECRPALAILDLCLPDGDGVELARELHALDATCPMVLMTAYPLRLREGHGGPALFSRVLTKPLNVIDLRKAVIDAIGSSAIEPVAATETNSLQRKT